MKLKKNSRTASPNAVVATTSISPFTRSAGKPTAQADRAGDERRRRASAGTSGQLREHGQHAGDIGADREEAGLREAHLAGQQHAIGREPEQRVDADDLDEAEIEIHRAALSRVPAAGANMPPGRNTRKANSSSMM